MDTESARTLLRMRWFQITMRPTVPNINESLNNIFGEGSAFVFDSYDMTMPARSVLFEPSMVYRLQAIPMMFPKIDTQQQKGK